MSLLLDDFKNRFKEIDEGLANDLVPIYENTYNSYYGGSYDNEEDKEPILLLIAHLVVTNPSYTGAGSAPVQEATSKSVGSVSVSYVAGSASNSFFNSTIYGQLYLMATRKNKGVAFV